MPDIYDLVLTLHLVLPTFPIKTIMTEIEVSHAGRKINMKVWFVVY